LWRGHRIFVFLVYQTQTIFGRLHATGDGAAVMEREEANASASSATNANANRFTCVASVAGWNVSGSAKSAGHAASAAVLRGSLSSGEQE
jgi:hypothetical protein